jgi:hypothetical protein
VVRPRVSLVTVGLLPYHPGMNCSPVLCILGAVQLLALATAGIARLVEGTRHEWWGQGLCLIGLAVIGGATGAAIRIGPGATATCAVTLAVMTLIAIAGSPRRR